MTALVALGPLAATPLFVWLLMEFGPERSVIFALYWIIPSIIFAIAMPVMRWRGRSLAQASARAAAWALAITILAFIGLFFGFTPRVGGATLDRAETVPQFGRAGGMGGVDRYCCHLARPGDTLCSPRDVHDFRPTD